MYFATEVPPEITVKSVTLLWFMWKKECKDVMPDVAEAEDRETPISLGPSAYECRTIGLLYMPKRRID